MSGHGTPDRRAVLREVAATPADLLVIGGGIVGAGIARDAAMRGLRTVLVEQHDLAWGTSGRSSRLIHGGLRYLEQYNLALVFEALRERAILSRIAPHLVRPLPFIFPVHEGDRVPRWKLAAGMWLYDLLSLFRNVSRHRMMGKRALLRHEPALRASGLQGGARYFDAQCDDARLVVATARSAAEHGATILSHAAVAELVSEGGRVAGALVRDAETRTVVRIAASVVVNATGPWCDRIRRMEDSRRKPLLRTTKGAHVVVPRDRLGNTDAITFTSPIDGRVMFVLPWGRWSYIGTTDTETSETPDEVHASPEDVRYLLRSANSRFPNARLQEQDVVATWAALRPLIEDGANGTSTVSREHIIVEGPGGMITVAGGKLTTYRLMAAQVVNRVVRHLRPRTPPWPADAGTDVEPLPGGESAELGPIRELGADTKLDADTVEHLLLHYGTEAAGIFNLVRQEPILRERLQGDHPAIGAEVVHAARKELARTVADVLVRRIHLYYETRDQGSAAAPRVAALLARELGWGRDGAETQVAAYRALTGRDPTPAAAADFSLALRALPARGGP
jgi:glycerol-3-phosphate dehydrogenase